MKWYLTLIIFIFRKTIKPSWFAADVQVSRYISRSGDQLDSQKLRRTCVSVTLCNCTQTQVIPTHFIDNGYMHLQKISQVAPRVHVVRNVAGVYVTRVVYIIKRLVSQINI